VVADAGGNAIDVVNHKGRIRNLAVFANRLAPNPFGGPDVPMQAVPTSVVKGPDRQYYVSQLTGFPFPPGAANVYRLNPRTGAVTVFASGFTNIMDLAFGKNGTLYVLEIDHDGLLGGSTDGGGLLPCPGTGTKRQIALAPGTYRMSSGRWSSPCSRPHRGRPMAAGTAPSPTEPAWPRSCTWPAPPPRGGCCPPASSAAARRRRAGAASPSGPTPVSSTRFTFRPWTAWASEASSTGRGRRWTP
jgi:hypothetical protein